MIPPAEASAAGSVICRHSGSCKENRRKRAGGLRIKSHTGKIHADAGLVGGAPAAEGAAVLAGAPILASRQQAKRRRTNLGQQAES